MIEISWFVFTKRQSQAGNKIKRFENIETEKIGIFEESKMFALKKAGAVRHSVYFFENIRKKSAATNFAKHLENIKKCVEIPSTRCKHAAAKYFICDRILALIFIFLFLFWFSVNNN